jgi:hypothetical protein
MTGTLKIKDMTPEQLKEYKSQKSKEMYKRNRVAIIEKCKKYYADNKEKMLPKAHDYYWDNREDYCENARIRRELKKMAAE